MGKNGGEEEGGEDGKNGGEDEEEGESGDEEEGEGGAEKGGEKGESQAGGSIRNKYAGISKKTQKRVLRLLMEGITLGNKKSTKSKKRNLIRKSKRN